MEVVALVLTSSSSSTNSTKIYIIRVTVSMKTASTTVAANTTITTRARDSPGPRYSRGPLHFHRELFTRASGGTR
jgi:hypothetical protein